MDVLDRNYAKKLASGIKSITVNSTNDGLYFVTNSGTSFDVKLPNFHSHSNLTILEKFSYDSTNNLLLYDGKPIVSGNSGATNYVDLTNKPSINGVELSGDKTLTELGIEITTTINSTSTDTQVPSAKSVYNELDKKIDKTSIVTTTINGNSTDAQVPSAKSIYYNCIEGIELDQTAIDTYGTEILKYPLGIWRINGNGLAYQFTDLPDKTSGRIEITSIDPNINKNPLTSSWSYRVYNFEAYTGENYIRKITSSNTAGVFDYDTGWQKVCTTSVADIPVTNIAPADTATFVNFKDNSSCNYCVKNGICYVSIWGVKIASTGNTIQTNVFLPKAANVRAGTLMAGSGDATCHALAYVLGETGELCFDVKDANVTLYGSFSYPVSES